jgi:murein DD-endopeptidase MepM/ murein hydrolase activator NlpD
MAKKIVTQPKISSKPNIQKRNMTITVQAQDTLFSIAKRYGMTVDQLKALNGLNTNSLSIGQQLLVSQASGTTPTPVTVPSNPSAPVGGTGLGLIAQRFGVERIPQAGFTQYRLSYPLPPNGTDTTVPIRNNVQSRFAVNPNGVMYLGKAKFDLYKEQFRDITQQDFYSNVLAFISNNEGCFDAVNSYDKAIFSFGFIQFTATSGSLLQVMTRLKQRDQYAFYDCFGQYGIEITNGRLTVLTPEADYYEDLYAWQFIASSMPHTAMFVASGFRRSMVRAQVEIAIENYILPALSDRNLVNVGGALLPINGILRSQGGWALRIDQCVNRGLRGSLDVLGQAINEVAAESGLRSSTDLSMIDEQAVVRKTAQLIPEKAERVNKLLTSGFGFGKV